MTSDQPGVTYTLSAFKRAKFVGGGQHLLLRSNQANDVALQALAEATYSVTEALREYEERDEAYVMLDSPIPTPNGPMTRVRDCEPAKALPLMLDRLAAELTARGITGTLTPVKDVFVDGPTGPVLGMILSPLNDTDAMYAAFENWRHLPLKRGSWVEEDRHRRIITSLMDWLTQIEGTVLIHTTTTIETSPEGLVDYVTQTLHSQHRFGISATSTDSRTRRKVRFAESEIIVYDFDLDHPRRNQLVTLTSLATRIAPDIAYALIRELRSTTLTVTALRKVPPTISLFNDLTHIGLIKHLEPHYVFDAGVAQVLTSSQLAKTTLPKNRWQIEDLGGDRHLVTALDPDPWFNPHPYYVHEGNTLPPDWTDPELLATARADFGHAILTLDTLRQHPPPLTSDQIRTDPTLRALGVLPPT